MHGRLIEHGGGVALETDCPNTPLIGVDIGHETPEARRLLRQAWERLDAAEAASVRLHRPALSLAVRQCRNRGEVDALMRVHKENAAVPSAKRYVVAYADTVTVRATKQDVKSLLGEGLLKHLGTVDGTAVFEPVHGAADVVAAAL